MLFWRRKKESLLTLSSFKNILFSLNHQWTLPASDPPFGDPSVNEDHVHHSHAGDPSEDHDHHSHAGDPSHQPHLSTCQDSGQQTKLRE